MSNYSHCLRRTVKHGLLLWPTIVLLIEHSMWTLGNNNGPSSSSSSAVVARLSIIVSICLAWPGAVATVDLIVSIGELRGTNSSCIIHSALHVVHLRIVICRYRGGGLRGTKSTCLMEEHFHILINHRWWWWWKETRSDRKVKSVL